MVVFIEKSGRIIKVGAVDKLRSIRRPFLKSVAACMSYQAGYFFVSHLCYSNAGMYRRIDQRVGLPGKYN